MKLYYETNLKHHGILGMRWGVRRYQNKDGTLTPLGRQRYEKEMGPNPYTKPVESRDYDRVVLKKGSEAQRISAKSNETPTGHTYISFKELDNLKYMEMAGTDGLYWTMEGDTDYGYKLRLKVTDDIIAPSYKKSVETFINSVKDVPMDELVLRTFGETSGKDSINKQIDYMRETEQFISDMENLSVNEARSRAYKNFSRSLMRSDENRKQFFNELKKQGYNAIVDENDADFAEAPLIVFERSKNLKQISATPITWKERDAATEKLYKMGQ